MARGQLLGALTTRLRLVDWRKRHAEVAQQEIRSPLFVLGLPRTGTTLLHGLLAQDERHRAPLTWEVADPCPAPERATFASDARIAAMRARERDIERVAPGFSAIHPMGALLPQECVRITALEFRSVIFPTQFRVPTYGRWILYEADLAPAYKWHREFLQLLQSRHPDGPDGAERWLLKSPAHIWCLDALLAEYPDALLVQTHRDPLRIIASVSSLQQTLRSMTSDDPSLPEIATEWAGYIIDGLDRSVTAREDGTVPADRIVDVHFDAFMADPLAVIRAIYERLGLELTADSEQRMRAFLAAHGQGEGGGHKYSFAATGLDEGELREKARRYQDSFGVSSEPLG
jgi:hypothetical protein